MLGDKGKRGAIEGMIELVVTAGRCKYNLSLPHQRLVQYDVGCGIARVQRYDKIRGALCLKIKNISADEGKRADAR